MPHPDAQIWNARYLGAGRHYQNPRAHRLLRDFADNLPQQGLVLEVAAGSSPDGIFLAKRGLHVIAMDISEIGLRLAQKRARKLLLPFTMVVMDLENPWLPASKFDIILNFYYLSRPLFECYRQALKPKGWLFFETFIQDAHRPTNPEHTLVPDELLAAFSGWDIVHWAETSKKPRPESVPSRKIAQMVARKTN